LLTARGVKPICEFQQVFKSTHLFGAFSPVDGNHFIKNLGKCTTENFQNYLNNFSLIKPAELKIVVLDNAAYEGGEVIIYDVMGRRVATVETGRAPSLQTTSLETTIDVSHLPAGMYFIKIGEKTVKFVKE